MSDRSQGDGRDRQPTRVTLFLFATGIENSYPTIQNGRVRRDQMEECGHYRLWQRDFELLADLDIRFLRYGPPLYTTFLGQGRYDWEFADLTFAWLKERDVVPIVDLCHFGVPDWIGDFQNPDFPALFAEYARAFAHRFPWVQFYTPVNEMFICAQFSAAFGWWNEQLTSDRAFVTALKHMAKANVLAMYAILEERPDAIFIQSESTEYFHADNPKAIKSAEFYNARRFLSLDLNYGYPVNSHMHEYLLDNGMTREEYHFFLDNTLRHHCIMGNDFYHSNEHRVDAGGRILPAGEVFGYDEITRQYHDRYGLPVMHTETRRPNPSSGASVKSSLSLFRKAFNVIRNDDLRWVSRSGSFQIVQAAFELRPCLPQRTLDFRLCRRASLLARELLEDDLWLQSPLGPVVRGRGADGVGENVNQNPHY